MEIIKLINNFLSTSDINLINDICGNNILDLAKRVDLSKYLNNTKHIASNFDVDGLHILRCVLSERIFEYKRGNLCVLANSATDEFLKNGILILPPIETKKDYNKFLNIIRYITANPNYNDLQEWLNNVKTDTHLDYDIQYTMHVDTFHPCFKVFRYVNDVDINNGPYSYVIGSNHNTPSKLKMLYDLSKRRSKNILEKSVARKSNHILWTDSLRIATSVDYCIKSADINNYLSSYGLPNETPITATKGSVIITDTSGLHRKYPSKKGYIRLSNRLILDRPNPFIIN